MAVHDDLHRLRDDSLRRICTLGGVRALTPQRSASSGLHRAWQGSIRSLDTKRAAVTDKDVDIISKYDSLEKLRMCNFNGDEYGNAAPAPTIISRLAPALLKLTSLSLRGHGSLDVLLVLPQNSGLTTRLQRLELMDGYQSLGPIGFQSLAKLTALSALVLRCQDYNGSTEDFALVSKNLPLLSNLRFEGNPLTSESAAGFPGSLTSLTSLYARSSAGFSSAVSALCKLQHLDCDYRLPRDAWDQGRLFQLLRDLKSLDICGNAEEHIDVHGAMLQQLSQLYRLDVCHCSITEEAVNTIFTSNRVKHLSARSLDVSPNWHGITANSCALEHLHLGAVTDEALANMPTLPSLQTFICTNIIATDRFNNTSAFLRRHASTIKHLRIGTDSDDTTPFQEPMPRELPRCETIDLLDMRATTSTLHTLASCTMPVLKELKLWLDSSVDQEMLHLETDFGWALELPQLRKLQVEGLYDELWDGMEELVGRTDGRVQFVMEWVV